MNKQVKTLVSSTLVLTALITGVVSSKPYTAKAYDVNALYADAYNATMNALSVRTQKSVNAARPKIEALKGTGAEWAVGEFSKQVDTVQHPILVKFVSAYNEAASALER